MQGKPKISITQFAGMGDKGIYCCDSCSPVVVNGRAAMSSGLLITPQISEDTTLYSNLGSPMDMAILDYGDSNKHGIVIDANNRLHMLGVSASGTDNKGMSYDFPFNTVYPSDLPNILVTSSGSILTTHSEYVGVGYFLKINAATATTLTARTPSGVSDFNFTTAGIANAVGRNIVFNITQGRTYTVTSVSTDTTLNFNSQTPAPAVNDYIYVYNSIKFSLGTTDGALNSQFIGQTRPENFNRKIIYWNDKYYILNGNFIATLSSDETTWTSDILDEYGKALPSKHQGNCMAVNQEKMMVGYSRDGLGGLLLWDGYASGWINKIELGYPVMGITAFKSGFVFTAGDAIYYTDGYQIQELGRIPDTRAGFDIIFSRTIVSSDDYIYVNVVVTRGGRSQSGMWVLNTLTGTFDRIRRSVNFMTVANTYNYVGYTDSLATATNVVGIVSRNMSTKYNFTLYLPLGQKINISQVELNINKNPNSAETESTNSTSISVSCGQGKRIYRNMAQLGTSNTTTALKNINGDTKITSVGQVVEIISGNCALERSFITGITNPGTTSEVLTISPALSAAPTNSSFFNIYDIYKTQTQTITPASPDIIPFTVSAFHSDELYINVEVSSNDVAPEITQINIY